MKQLRLPPLAVGIGIYLPMSATFAVVVGAVSSGTGTTSARAAMPNPERAERLGTLVASGLIVGESLFGVLNAGLIVGFANDAPIALVPEAFAPAKVLGLVGFVGLVYALYRWMLQARGSPVAMTDDDILVVGAGPAGLAVSASLRDRGLAHRLIEREPDVASSWRRHYTRLHLHTIKQYSGLPGMPWPADTPKYPSRRARGSVSHALRSRARGRAHAWRRSSAYCARR